MPPPLSGLKTLNFGLKTSIFDLTEFILILMLFSALRHTKVYFHFFVRIKMLILPRLQLPLARGIL